MSEWFYKRINFLVGWSAIASIFVLMMFLANVEIKDLDLWLHLATGKFILGTKTIPHVDIFSFSLIDQPWINHEWLFQVVVYAAYQLFGFDGLINLQVILVALSAMLLFFLGYNRDRNLIAACSLLLVVFVYQTRFTIRPDLFSLLFLMIYLHVINFHLDKKESLLTIFLVQVLWTNIHGFFIMGPALIIIYIVGELIKRKVPLPCEWNAQGRFSNIEYKRLYILLFISIAACLLNPYGINGLIYPLNIISSVGGEAKVFFKYISELQPAVSLDTFFNFGIQGEFKILILSCFALLILNFRRLDISQFILTALFLVFSLKAIRNIPFFAFIAFMSIMRNSNTMDWNRLIPLEFNSAKRKLMVSIALQFFLIIWVLNYFKDVSNNGYFDFNKLERKSEYGGVSLRNFPNKAVDFLLKNNIKGNFLNDFNSGAYLIGRGKENVKVFIDGRTELYGSKFFKNYQSALDGNISAIEEILLKHNPTGVFLSGVQSAIPGEILYFFYEHKDWTLIYFDYDAVIFLKNIPENQDWIKKLKVNLGKFQTKKFDLIQLGAVSVTPFEYIHRAANFLSIHLNDQAMNEALEVLRIDPRSSAAYKIIGQIYLDQKDYVQAFENLRKAKLLNPDDRETRYYLGICYYQLGNFEKATALMDLILQGAPENSKALSFLALINARQKNTIEVWSLLNRIKRMPVMTEQTVLEVALVLRQQNQLEDAKKVYELILKMNPNQIQAKRELGEMK